MYKIIKGIDTNNLPDKLALCLECVDMLTSDHLLTSNCDFRKIIIDKVPIYLLESVCKRHSKRINTCKKNVLFGRSCGKCQKYVLSKERADCINLLDIEISYCKKCYENELEKPISETEKMMFDFLVEQNRKNRKKKLTIDF